MIFDLTTSIRLTSAAKDASIFDIEKYELYYHAVRIDFSVH